MKKFENMDFKENTIKLAYWGFSVELQKKKNLIEIVQKLDRVLF